MGRETKDEMFLSIGVLALMLAADPLVVAASSSLQQASQPTE